MRDAFWKYLPRHTERDHAGDGDQEPVIYKLPQKILTQLIYRPLRNRKTESRVALNTTLHSVFHTDDLTLSLGSPGG